MTDALVYYGLTLGWIGVLALIVVFGVIAVRRSKASIVHIGVIVAAFVAMVLLQFVATDALRNTEDPFKAPDRARDRQIDQEQADGYVPDWTPSESQSLDDRFKDKTEELDKEQDARKNEFDALPNA